MRKLISFILVIAALGSIVAAVLMRPRFGHPVTEEMREDATAATRVIVSPLPNAIDRRPLVVIFILPGCPCSESYEPCTQQLFQAFGSKVQFLGIVEGTDQEALTWKQKHQTPFEVIADEDGSLAERFQARRSAYTALIVEGDAITKLWPGYSQAMLDELSERLREETKLQLPNASFEDAPKELTSGCLIDRS